MCLHFFGSVKSKMNFHFTLKGYTTKKRKYQKTISLSWWCVDESLIYSLMQNSTWIICKHQITVFWVVRKKKKAVQLQSVTYGIPPQFIWCQYLWFIKLKQNKWTPKASRSKSESCTTFCVSRCKYGSFITFCYDPIL